jgi:iron complex outermembrane receptor protein
VIHAVIGFATPAGVAVGGHVETNFRNLGSVGLLALAYLASNGPAQAQVAASGPGAGIEEVLVTAQRRVESLQSVPVSMDAISGATLENLGDKNFFDYATSIPNLTVGIGTGAGGNGSGFGVSSTRSVTIRGVAGNNTTGFYLNDTPLPLSLDPRVLDIDRIEVLRGPQGTLFGAGSMGGTVRLITRQPSLEETSGKVDLEGSKVNHGDGGYSADATLNVPLIKGEVALRISAFSAFEPGYFTREWGFVTSPPVALRHCRPMLPRDPSQALVQVRTPGPWPLWRSRRPRCLGSPSPRLSSISVRSRMAIRLRISRRVISTRFAP